MLLPATGSSGLHLRETDLYFLYLSLSPVVRMGLSPVISFSDGAKSLIFQFVQPFTC